VENKLWETNGNVAELAHQYRDEPFAFADLAEETWIAVEGFSGEKLNSNQVYFNYSNLPHCQMTPQTCLIHPLASVASCSTFASQRSQAPNDDTVCRRKP
jgi:hypothetical protein